MDGDTHESKQIIVHFVIFLKSMSFSVVQPPSPLPPRNPGFIIYGSNPN